MRMREIAPVIPIKPFAEAVAEGCDVEVLAQEDIVSRGGSVTGAWILYVLLRDDASSVATRAVLIKQRAAEPRVIKTAKGLIALAIQLGIREIVLPHREGQRAIWHSAVGAGVGRNEEGEGSTITSDD